MSTDQHDDSPTERKSSSLRNLISEKPAMSSAASAHIAAIRGIAAIAVLIGHARNLFLIDYAEIPHHSLWLATAYGMTLFGRQAVMVFFILSGYLIGSSVLRSVESDRWSTARYCVHRIVRLEVVLLPALIFGMIWDQTGIHHFGLHGIYGGHTHASVVTYNVLKTISWPIFLGNFAFLQALRVPCLGSNDPLWSLAYEFWYYALFPCVVLVLTPRVRLPIRAMRAVLCVALACFMGRYLLDYFPIWLLGTVTFILPKPKLSGFAAAGMLYLAGFIFVCDLILTKGYWKNAYISDYSVAITFAFFLYWLLHQSLKVSDGYKAISNNLSSSSYTLYVVHMPFLVFISAWVGIRWMPTAGYMACTVAIICLACIYARIVYMLFEANTNRLRRWIECKLQLH